MYSILVPYTEQKLSKKPPSGVGGDVMVAVDEMQEARTPIWGRKEAAVAASLGQPAPWAARIAAGTSVDQS